MNIVKKIVGLTTGYWMHKLSSLPVGADLFVDIHKKIQYPPLPVIFDVGANQGQTLHWARFNEPGAKIYSFEPVASTFQQLQQRAAGDNNCVIENIAFGDAAGQKTIRLFDSDLTVLNSLKDELMNNTGNAREETITIDTLDNYCRKNSIQKIDLLKIDTEGYEMNVLAGAQELLQSGSISFIYCEVGFMKQNTRNTYFAELTEYLAAKNYYFFGLYQVDSHDWVRGNHLGNALYIRKDIFPTR